MDSFAENILARARERQRMLQDDKIKPLLETNTKSLSQPNLTQSKMVQKKETLSDTNLSRKFKNCEQVHKENSPNKQKQSSKTRVSSDLSCSPKTHLKTLNIQKDSLNMEIKVRSSENVRVEVEIEEMDRDSDTGSHEGLREDAKKRLNRLGKLYAGGEDADISSPIHKTEAKFYQNEEETNCRVSSDNKKSKKGLSKLADLAQNINQWEDDLSHPSKVITSPKKAWKTPAPQPPGETNSPMKKPKAPSPPTQVDKNNPTEKSNAPKSSPKNVAQVVDVTPKQIKWDQAVLDTLESQGFTRTTSNSRLVYSYNSQEMNQKPEVIKTANKSKLAKITNDTKTDTIKEEEEEPLKSIKAKTRVGVVADRAVMFETPSSPVRSTNTKDPALMSVSERKALFEKNKGAALVPKAAFGMAAPVKDAKVVPKPALPKKINDITPVKAKYLAPKPPVTSNETKAAVPQAGGIATKMAALLEGKSTISEEQIFNKAKEERQKELNMLLNRFNKNKEIVEVHHQPQQHYEDESDEDNDDERTAMLQKSVNKTIITSPEERKSGQKRLSNSDSPVVAAVLEDVKRIKVTQPKAGRLYPNLSDIEGTTESETLVSDESNNSSVNEDVYDSDNPNTSFGRDILQEICKNETPQKRPVYDESTASDISSALDDYIDELDEDVENNGPSPPKQGRQSPNSHHAAQPSHSFHFKSYTSNIKSPPKAEFRSPMKVPSPRKSLENQLYVVEGDNILPLTHTVSFYRKQQTQVSKTPVRHISRQPIVEEIVPNNKQIENSEIIANRIKVMEDEVNKQQMIISQTSQALNLCNSTPEFSGSTEQVEAEKVLLVATHRREAAWHEIQRLKVEGTLKSTAQHAINLPLEKGTLTISNIVLPLKQKYVTALAAAGGKGHHVVCLVKCGEQVVPSKLVSTVASSNKKNPDVELCIPGTITINNIYSDFTLTFEVYCLQAQEEFLPHEVKYHINNKKNSNKLTPKKNKQDSRLQRPIKESPAGPHAVRSSSFALMGYVVFAVQAVNKKHWTLNNTPPMSPLEGIIQMKISCDLKTSVEHRGFLNMFEDVSGFGAWHRRWFLLQSNTLSYWKYPDDERKMAPINTIHLKDCITKQVGPVSRDICARLHTFLLERERVACPQDKDTLVMVCKGNKTVIRHLLSADTKEERIEWCQKLNASLTALRMWGSDNN